MAEPNDVESIRVEIAYAEPGRQFLRGIQCAAGATVADAILASEVGREFGIDTNLLTVGIWSKPVARDVVLRDGDRVELYRSLKADPKDSRRRRAERTPIKRR